MKHLSSKARFLALIATVLIQFASTALAQYVNVQVQVTRMWHSEYGSSGGDCWETGTEEFSGRAYANLDGGGWQGGSCFTCDNNGDCSANITYTPLSTNTLATTVGVRYWALEDDSGDRCSNDSGDDCFYDGNWSLNIRSLPRGTWNTYNNYGNDDHTMNFQIFWNWIAPTAPSISSATGIGNTSFTATWSGPANYRVTNYYLDVATDSSFANLVPGYDGVNEGTATSRAVTGLTAGQTYYFRVKAVNEAGGSGFSSNGSAALPKFNQTIAFSPLAAVTYGDPSFSLSASSSSGLPVSFSSLNPSVATVTGNTVNIVAPGTAVIRASQAGNASFNPAPNVGNPLMVEKAAQTITFAALPQKILGDAPFAILATASSGLAVTFDSLNPTVATVSENTVTILAPGETTIRASQAGNGFFLPAADAERTLIVKVLEVIVTPDNIAENQPPNSPVGTLAAANPIPGENYTFALIPGAGDTGNDNFLISGDQLLTSTPLDHETAASHSIRVRLTDSQNRTTEGEFIIHVIDNNTEDDDGDGLTEAQEEALGTSDKDTDSDNDGLNDNVDTNPLVPGSVPTAITLTPSAVDENRPAGTTIGSLSATDADGNEAFTYQLVAGDGDTDNARVAITGTQLVSARSFDQETTPSLSVRVRVTDKFDNAFESPLTITVNDLTNEDADRDGLTEAQEQAQGTSDTDADSDDDGLPDGSDPFPTQPNTAPTAIALSPSTVSEGKPSGTTVGTLTATDPDSGETFQFALVSGAGATHNGSFTIVGDQLRTAAILDNAVIPTASIRVRVTDSAGHVFEQGRSITITESGDEFVVAALPDIQNYSENYPQILKAQTQWIVNNRIARNIGFVSFLGDMVNHHDRQFEWDNARAGANILENAGIPWSSIPGNHDSLYGDGPDDFNCSRYLAKFGPQYFANKPWYRGASNTGLSNYQIIDFGSATILFLHLNLETPASELAWAQGVINQHRNLPVWVSTHRYMQDAEHFTGGVPLVSSGRFPEIWYTFEPLYRPDGMKSEVFFNSFVRGNKNIFIVQCGHFHAEYRQTSTNNFGLTVHEILADYQDDPNGGDGWMRLCTFRPAQNEIFVQTLSPTFNNPAPTYNGPSSNRTGSESQFTLNVNLSHYTSAPGSQLVRFQNGVGGYTSTQDTWINSDTGGFGESDGPDVNTNYGNSGSLEVDNDWDNYPFGDETTQAMIKFGSITQPPVYEGDPIPTKVPTNATITRAVLSYNVTDDTDIGEEDMLVYRCNKTWEESTATWNSLDNGLSGSEIVLPGIVVDGDNDPDLQTVRNVTVTNIVSAWFGPSAVTNNGFAILPENISNNDDGMTLASSESSDVSLRPALDIEFTYPTLNRPPTVTTLAASPSTLLEGQSVVITMSANDANPNDPVLLKVNGAEVGFGLGSASYNEVVVLEQNGSYQFSGQVSDDEATVSGGSLTVTVNNANPSIASLTGNLTVEVGESFGFNATATDPGVQDILTYQWDLDADGQFDDATGSSGSHSFATAGIHVVSVRVADGDGGSATGSFNVTVTEDPFIAFAALYNLVGGKDGDDDGDGFSNEIERILGNLPNDANDRLTLTINGISRNPATGRTEVDLTISELRPVGIYRLYWTADLNTPRENWTLVRTFDPSAPADDVPVEDELAGNRTMATEPRGFYQLRFEAASAP